MHNFNSNHDKITSIQSNHTFNNHCIKSFKLLLENNLKLLEKSKNHNSADRNDINSTEINEKDLKINTFQNKYNDCLDTHNGKNGNLSIENSLLNLNLISQG